MLENGVIVSSTNDWAAQVVLVKKKDRTLRLSVDYRRLNAVSKMDAYPTPQFDNMIDSVGRAKFISTLDLLKLFCFFCNLSNEWLN